MQKGCLIEIKTLYLSINLKREIMAKSKKNSGFFAQGNTMSSALATAKRPASTTDAVHQAIELGRKKKKPQTEKVAMSFAFLINGK